ncbi:MAG: hypothetical protein CFE29_03785 [Bradyrhizobiaceae bacterium PARB1]|jgi:calcineurin-like phosphoesterase family protein|nr:MAG: hypothetical protein CFE29_03785 [Bradyrhizobiaceae bacterium PARB1]
MARIHFFSDLHVDHAGGDIGVQPVDCDLAVFGGDLCNGLHKHLPDLLEKFRGVPLVVTEGNHDAYREGPANDRAYTLQDVRDRTGEICARYGAYYNPDGYVVIDGVQVITACLWSDFSIRPGYMSPKEAMYISQKGFHPEQPVSPAGRTPHNDYQAIHTAPGKRLTPSDTLAMHKASVEAIDLALDAEPDMLKVLATHFPPDDGVASDGTHSWLYGSRDCGHIIERADIWLHGHVHVSRDAEVGGTRIISNPRGYRQRDGRFENPAFDPSLVIDVEPKPRNDFGMK